METKEVIKNALREKLQHLSQEELIDIIADLSAGYIAVRMFAEGASALSSFNPIQHGAEFAGIINATASKINKQDFSNQQVCKADDWLFNRKEL